MHKIKEPFNATAVKLSYQTPFPDHFQPLISPGPMVMAENPTTELLVGRMDFPLNCK